LLNRTLSWRSVVSLRNMSGESNASTFNAARRLAEACSNWPHYRTKPASSPISA
jgi:hypothetical protein